MQALPLSKVGALLLLKVGQQLPLKGDAFQHIQVKFECVSLKGCRIISDAVRIPKFTENEYKIFPTYQKV